MTVVQHDHLTVTLVAGESFSPQTAWLDAVESVSVRFGGISLVLSDLGQVNRLADAVAVAMSMFVLHEAAAETAAATAEGRLP